MKYTIFLLFIVSSIYLTGQPIINKAFEPKGGENYYTRGYVYESSPMLWKTGPNQYWEFPYFSTYDYSEFINYTSLDTEAFNDSFSKATHYRKITDTTGKKSYLYYFSSPDSFCYLGYINKSPDYTLVGRWIDPEVTIKFPIKYKDSITDNGYFFFEGRDNDGSDSSTSYNYTTITTVADGYGKILFKNVILDSVLRLRIITTTIKKWYLFYDSLIYKHDTTTKTSLVWLSNKYNRPIVTVELAGPYNKNKVMTAFYFNANIYLGKENFTETEQIQCYPNPANEKIKIEGIKNLVSVEIKDVTGKSFGVTANGIDEIPIANLQAGMYLLYAKTQTGQVVVTKFIKN